MFEIRAHNLLCIQGFVGMGYSDKFIKNMSSVVMQLNNSPDQVIKVTTSPDHICEACPHLSNSGCTLKGDGHEKHMRFQDLEVLQRLGLRNDEEMKWIDITKRISEKIEGRDLKHICAGCPWLESGVCAKGIDTLKFKEWI